MPVSVHKRAGTLAAAAVDVRRWGFDDKAALFFAIKELFHSKAAGLQSEIRQLEMKSGALTVQVHRCLFSTQF